MNQIQIVQPAIIEGFDYATLDDEDLATECRAAAGRIKGRHRTVILEIVEIGRDLIAIQAMMPHGAWGPWIESEVGFTDRTAQNYMHAAVFAEGKSETVSLLPPATLYALASPKADPDVRQQVLDDVKAGKVMKTADVKEKLAEARTAKKKAEAAQKKTPEQIAKEKATQERSDRAWQKKNDDIDRAQAEAKARQIETAGKAARLLVTKLGATGTIELFNIMDRMNRVSFDLVKQLLSHSGAGGYPTFLPAEEIEKRFGSGSVS
jgi:phage protein D